MKSVKKLTLLLSTVLAIALTACERHDDLPNNRQEEKTEYYISPTPSDGRLVLIYPNPRKKSYLGHGYDIMGSYLSDLSVKNPIINMEEISKIGIDTLVFPANSAAGFQGKDANEFLESLMLETKYTTLFKVPERNKGDLLFTGTITDCEYISDSYNYSTLYSFAGLEVANTREQHTMSYFTSPQMLARRYLSDDFKGDLEYGTAEDLVELYGTHLIVSIRVGYSIRSLYRAVITAEEKDMASTAYDGLGAKLPHIYNRTGNKNTTDDDKRADNWGGAIAVEFQGGNLASLPHPVLLPNELVSGPINISAWEKSANRENYTLTALRHLIPIYELIEDPVKRQQVENAVVNHIKSRQLTCMKVAPILQVYNEKSHLYFTSYTDFQKNPDKSYSLKGVIGSIFIDQQPKTVPLYLFSNGKNHRLSLEENPENLRDFQYNRIIGYVYNSYLSGSGLQAIYEISDGTHYAYTTERKDTYGEEGKWLPTGKEFYTRKIAL